MLRHDWLAFLDDAESEGVQLMLESKVRMHLYWRKLRSLISFQKLKKFVVAIRQRAVNHYWFLWWNQAVKSGSICCFLSAVRLSPIQITFSGFRELALQARHLAFMMVSVEQMILIKAVTLWRSKVTGIGMIRKASIYFCLYSLKSSLELIQSYSAGAADHTRAVNSRFLVRTFVA